MAGRRKGGLGGEGNAAARRPSGSAKICAEVALSEVLKPPSAHPSSASAGPPAGAGKAPSPPALARAVPGHLKETSSSLPRGSRSGFHPR